MSLTPGLAQKYPLCRYLLGLQLLRNREGRVFIITELYKMTYSSQIILIYQLFEVEKRIKL